METSQKRKYKVLQRNNILRRNRIINKEAPRTTISLNLCQHLGYTDNEGLMDGGSEKCISSSACVLGHLPASPSSCHFSTLFEFRETLTKFQPFRNARMPDITYNF
jgi:hypothetical protein